MVISGTGAVTPIGIGNEQFWDHVKNGVQGVRKTNRFPSLNEIPCAEIYDMDFLESLVDKRMRRSADISRYAFAAAGLAIKDSGSYPINETDTALIMGITHGALNYTQDFHASLIKEGVYAASPLRFSDSVLNAPAGNTSICLGVRGSVHTLLGGAETAVKAVMLACRILESGWAGKAVVVCAEELNELSASCYLRKGVTGLSEGAGAVVIERDRQDRLSHHCVISGASSLFYPSDPDAALSWVIAECLAKADLKAQDISFVITDGKMPAELSGRNIPAGSVIHLTGNAFATSALWQIILSSLIIKNDTIPETVVRDGAMIPDRVRHIMMFTVDRQGHATAVILSGR
jgi:3-oxoacyl-(acyl-carrier-protein) synthase